MIGDDIFDAIFARQANWNQINEFIAYFRNSELHSFTTIQLMCFTDIETYVRVHSASGESVDDLLYSYLVYFFWPWYRTEDNVNLPIDHIDYDDRD